MSNNIFQVITQKDLDEIIDEHSGSLIVLMYSSKSCPACVTIKPAFISMAKSNNDCFFVYIDVNRFEDPTQKYTKGISHIPRFAYLYNKQEISTIIGADEEKMIKTLAYLRQLIEHKKRQHLEAKEAVLKQQQLQQQQLQQQQLQQQQLQQQQLQQQHLQQQQLQQQHLQQQQQHQFVKQQSDQINPSQQLSSQQSSSQQLLLQQDQSSPDALFQKKVFMLKKLFDLTKSGVVLTQSYNLDSDYTDMEWEYNLHTNPKSIQVNKSYVPPDKDAIATDEEHNHIPATLATSTTATTNEQAEALKKQEQLKKIQELNQLNHMIQMQQMYKLQQWKNLQRMKEQKEREMGDNATERIDGNSSLKN